MKQYFLDVTIFCHGMQMAGDTIPSGKSLGGCVTGDTPIDIPRDLKTYPAGIPIKEVCDRFNAGEMLHVYSYDRERGAICLKPIVKAWRTRRGAELWELAYSWETSSGERQNATLRATPDHRIMLRDGSYKHLRDLSPGDSLMPFNRFQGKRKDAKYFRIDLNDSQWEYEHQFIPRALGHTYRPKRGVVGDIVHHINFKWHDNSIGNLRVMDWKDHLALHKGSNPAFRKWYNGLSEMEYQEFCEKEQALSRGYWYSMTREERKKANAPSVARLIRWHNFATPEQLRQKYDKISIGNKLAFQRNPELLIAAQQRFRSYGGHNKGIPQSAEAKKKQAEIMRRNWTLLSPEQRTQRLTQLQGARAVRLNNHIVTSVRSLSICEDVYDIEVQDTHNFAANGIIIHNSETCAIQAAEEMARQGHRPVIFCNTERQHETNGVVYMPIGWVKQANGNMFPKGFLDYARSTPHDVLIIQRLPGIASWEFQSKVNFLWQHDLATKTGPSNFHGTMWNVDRILVISEFMKKQYQEVHGGPDSVFHVTRNGIDIGLIDSVPDQGRDRFKVMFTARPERGLDIMLGEVLPRLLQREPRIQLHISRYDDVATLPLYQQCAEMAKRYGDRVVNLGNLSKQELYKHYKQARVYAYSSVFEEVSCLSLAEVAACGGVFVGPWKAALPEHKGGAPVLIRDDGSVGQPGDPLDKGLGPVSPKFCDRMADEIIDLIHNDERWARLSKRGRENAERWTWEAVVKDWVDLAHQIIAERSSEPRRLVKHFLVNSDVVAAQRYVGQLGDEKLQKSVDRYVDRFVPFMALEDGAERRAAMAKFYEDRSGGDGASWQTAFWADQEPRLQVLRDWIAQQGDKIGSVLDFGCAHGGYARALSNAFSSLRALGLDVSPSLIRCANELRTAKLPDGSPACLHPENIQFMVGDEDTNVAGSLALEDSTMLANPDGTISLDNKFDLVACMEVLEHVPDSEAVIKKLERHCKPGGWMAFTVPHGHRERDEFVTKGVPPVHVRSFDRHDLVDLFGHRQDFQIVAFSDFKELDYDRTFSGWFMVLYRNDGQDVGQIDYERKFFLQGPRETVSVCMITNNAENTLHRALKSVVKLADEIIVIDNGPSIDSTVEIARQYTPDVRLGTSPFWCYAHKARHQPMEIRPGQCDMAGFETPRNESLQGAWGDHILWIDSDEALLNWQDVWKYLRPNCYLGYAVNQHHLSVDAQGTMRTDIPCRIFRNHRGLRFYGLVHEHAETAINGGIGPQNIVIPINIHHDGYANESIRRGRFNRNLRLLECDRLKYPDRILGIYLYEVRDNVHMARYAMEAAGGQVTDEVRRYCWGVVNAYRKHFLGKPVLLAQDGILYYSDALTMLGLGVEVALDIDVRQQGAHLNGGGTRCRVMDYEEAKLVTDHLLDQKFGPWRGRYIA